MTLDELEKLARGATIGPWSEDDGNIFSTPLSQKRYEIMQARLDGANLPHPDRELQNPMGWIASTEQGQPKFDEDARFIAAANPDTVLKLIARLRAAERVCEIAPTTAEVEAELDAWRLLKESDL